MAAERASVSPNRAERPLVIALDIGSSSVRAALHDRRGRVLTGCAAQVPYGWETAPGGSVRIPPRVLLDVVGQAIDGLVQAAGPLTADVVAGGISCFFHSIVGLDAAGKAITPLLSWADTTSADEATRLREQLDPQRTHASTGTPINAGFWPARILRLRTEQRGVARWAGFPELVAEALIGDAAVSRSMASGTGLLDRARGTWSDELMKHLRVDQAHVPRLVDDDAPLGRLSAPAARRWPQLARVSWFAAWGDGACGNVGLAATGPARAALMVGTSGALRAVLADPAPSVPAGLFAFRLLAGTVVGGQLSEGGGVLAWAAALLGRSRASLERAAAALEADAHGLTVLPYPFGERGLGYHDTARGSLVGLTPATDAPAIYRAILEAIAFGYAAVDDRLSQVLRGAPAVVASGGALARSPLLAQILADALGRDIAVAPAFEASRRGAALLALHGTGELTDLDGVAGPPVRLVRSDPGVTSRYATARMRQRKVYEAVLG